MNTIALDTIFKCLQIALDQLRELDCETQEEFDLMADLSDCLKPAHRVLQPWCESDRSFLARVSLGI